MATSRRHLPSLSQRKAFSHRPQTAETRSTTSQKNLKDSIKPEKKAHSLKSSASEKDCLTKAKLKDMAPGKAASTFGATKSVDRSSRHPLTRVLGYQDYGASSVSKSKMITCQNWPNPYREMDAEVASKFKLKQERDRLNQFSIVLNGTVADDGHASTSQSTDLLANTKQATESTLAAKTGRKEANLKVAASKCAAEGSRTSNPGKDLNNASRKTGSGSTPKQGKPQEVSQGAGAEQVKGPEGGEEEDEEDDEEDEKGLPQAVRNAQNGGGEASTSRQIWKELHREKMEKMARKVEPEDLVSHLNKLGYFNYSYDTHTRTATSPPTNTSPSPNNISRSKDLHKEGQHPKKGLDRLYMLLAHHAPQHAM